MSEKINNLCWEFCYEFIPAQIGSDGVPQVLILNLPSVFQHIIEGRLLQLGFFCTRTIYHGETATIMQFKKVAFPVGG